VIAVKIYFTTLSITTENWRSLFWRKQLMAATVYKQFKHKSAMV